MESQGIIFHVRFLNGGERIKTEEVKGKNRISKGERCTNMRCWWWYEPCIRVETWFVDSFHSEMPADNFTTL